MGVSFRERHRYLFVPNFCPKYRSGVNFSDDFLFWKPGNSKTRKTRTRTKPGNCIYDYVYTKLYIRFLRKNLPGNFFRKSNPFVFKSSRYFFIIWKTNRWPLSTTEVLSKKRRQIGTRVNLFMFAVPQIPPSRPLHFFVNLALFRTWSFSSILRNFTAILNLDPSDFHYLTHSRVFFSFRKNKKNFPVLFFLLMNFYSEFFSLVDIERDWKNRPIIA